MATGIFMEWKHRHLFLILSLVVVVLLHENLNNFHKAFAQLQSTPLQLLAHMWSWTQQSCRKRPQASFLPYRETPSHSWCDISFPQLTIFHLGLKLWSYTTEDSGSFALQFNLMTVARLYPLFSNLLGVFSLALYNNLTFKQSWNYLLPKVCNLWAKLSDPDQTEVREGWAGSSALLVSSAEVFSGGNTCVQKARCISVAFVKQSVSQCIHYSFSEDWFKDNTITPLR